MNLDDIQQLWNSTGNQPNATQRDMLVNQFTRSVRCRRRQELGWLIWTFTVLMAITGFVVWLIFGTDKVNLASEWAVIPLLLLPWTFAGLFLRRFIRGRMPVHRGDVTIADSLAAAMATNQAQQFKLRAVGVLYVVFLPVLAVSIWQLHAVGKVSSRELVSMILFMSVVLGISATAVFARYYYRVVPEGQKLKALLQQLQS